MLRPENLRATINAYALARGLVVGSSMRMLGTLGSEIAGQSAVGLAMTGHMRE